MADSISIPGVSDKYNTSDLIEKLMAVEKKPLNREKESLEKYKTQQTAWRDLNQKMSDLRTSVKDLYSFENPFNNKLASSTDENAITAEASREAEYGTFKIDVLNPATADRFLSGNIDKNMEVPAGVYDYTVGDKTVHFNWKGGKLSDWVSGLNKRGNQTVKASLIGVSKDKQTLLIESLKTGQENKLQFKEEALNFAKSTDMLKDVKSETSTFSSSVSSYKTPSTTDDVVQKNMPSISKDNVTSDGKNLKIPARGGVEIEIPQSTKSNLNNKIEFTYSEKSTEDITTSINNKASGPSIPLSGGIEFKGVSVDNNQSETTLSQISEEEKTPVVPISNGSTVFFKNADGTEEEVNTSNFQTDGETGKKTISIAMKDYPNAESIVIRNSSTGKEISVSVPESFDSSKDLGYAPSHAITTADDAKFKYEGITLTRSTNDVDDVVPNVTLHIHETTDKTATIKISPDKDSAKNALITFVGKYNQTIAEMNILSQDKPELISELDYLTDDEKESEEKKLGMFQGDSILSNGKTSLQRIVSASYKYSDEDTLTMLGQIGISTNASSSGGGYNATKLRGYLEVDEKKLDTSLETDLEQIKQIFGFDSDGDLVIDNGIGYKLDKQLTAWVQSGGIIATKNSTLDKTIKNSNEKIAKLETQMEDKESELKSKYASMEGSINSLESQSSTISNFSKQNSGNSN
ncbi:MAG: flagellar filament capping protein FliD [Treponema sp.]